MCGGVGRGRKQNPRSSRRVQTHAFSIHSKSPSVMLEGRALGVRCENLWPKGSDRMSSNCQHCFVSTNSRRKFNFHDM